MVVRLVVASEGVDSAAVVVRVAVSAVEQVVVNNEGDLAVAIVTGKTKVQAPAVVLEVEVAVEKALAQSAKQRQHRVDLVFIAYLPIIKIGFHQSLSSGRRITNFVSKF